MKPWQIFPCNRNKEPLTKNGFKDATSDKAQIAAWARQYPSCLWGMRPGPSGLIVLDFDVNHKDKNGKDKPPYIPRSLENALGLTILPETLECHTPAGGRHLYYAIPEDFKFTVRNGALQGLDIRCHAGYVIYATEGSGYLWSVVGAEPVPAPPVLLVWLMRGKSTLELPKGGAGGEGGGKEGELWFGVGCRSSAILSLGGKLRSLGIGDSALRACLEEFYQTQCETDEAFEEELQLRLIPKILSWEPGEKFGKYLREIGILAEDSSEQEEEAHCLRCAEEDLKKKQKKKREAVRKIIHTGRIGTRK
jgi:hypothetical protein